MKRVLTEKVAYVIYVSYDILLNSLNMERNQGRIVEGKRKEITQQRRNKKEMGCKNLSEASKGTVRVCFNLGVKHRKGNAQKRGSRCPCCWSL